MINECCKNKENLELQPVIQPGSELRICKVCGRRHRRLIAEPGVIGVIGKSIGRQ